MTTLDSANDESRLDEEAAEWLFERDEGFSPDRAEAFQHWCNRHRRHAAAVARAERTLALLDEMPEVAASLEARILQNVPQPKPGLAPAGRVVNFRPWAWAAGLAAALVIGTASVWVAMNRGVAAVAFATDATGPRRIALMDGSVVDLNSNSNLQVKFSDGERHVTLAAGEAHFQVAHNAARPFIVTANGISVRAVGTAFNVRLESSKVEVLVTEGKVEVDRQAPTGSNRRTAPVIPLLSAGERTQISLGLDLAPAVDEVGSDMINSLLSWQDRMTSFTDVPLREMIVRMNRCNSTQLVLSDPELGDRRIGGVIALNQVSAFVRLLEQDGDIVAERRGTEILLRRTH